jgi:hypothetical protein
MRRIFTLCVYFPTYHFFTQTYREVSRWSSFFRMKEIYHSKLIHDPKHWTPSLTNHKFGHGIIYFKVRLDQTLIFCDIYFYCWYAHTAGNDRCHIHTESIALKTKDRNILTHISRKYFLEKYNAFLLNRTNRMTYWLATFHIIFCRNL